MTPEQFAREQCANYNPDKSCMGVGIDDDLRPFSFGRKPRCVLANSERCNYFESTVLPMTLDVAGTAEQKTRNKKFNVDRAEVKRIYSQQTGAVV